MSNRPSKLDAAIAVIQSCQRADKIAGTRADYGLFPYQIVAAAGDILAAYLHLEGGVTHEEYVKIKRQLNAATARASKVVGKPGSDDLSDGELSGTGL